MTRKLTMALAATCAVLVAACSPQTDSNEIKIGTSNEAGTNYFVGIGIAKTVSKHTDLEVDAEASAGGLENSRLVSRNKQQVALVSPTDLAEAFGDGTADPKNIRLLMAGYPTTLQIVVRRDSGIKSVADLFKKGNRIGVGEAGSMIQAASKMLLATQGLDFDDIEPVELSQSGMADALKDGEVDGAVLGGGIPVASISDVNTSVGVRILPTDDDLFAELKEKIPSLVQIDVPAGTYKGIDTAIPTMAVPTWLIASSEVDEDAAYEFVKAIQSNIKELAKIHPAAGEFDLKDSFLASDYLMNDLDVEFHKGAVRWYEEKGVWPPPAE